MNRKGKWIFIWFFFLCLFVFPVTAQENKTVVRIVRILPSGPERRPSTDGTFDQLYLSEIAKYSGLKYTFVDADSEVQAVQFLEAGKADIIPLIEKHDQLQGRLFYSADSPFTFRVVIAAGINGSEHISGGAIRVGRLDGDSFTQGTDDTPLPFTCTFINFRDQPALFKALSENRIDAVAMLDVNLPPGFEIIADIRQINLFTAFSRKEENLLITWNWAVSRSTSLNPDSFDEIVSYCFPGWRMQNPILTGSELAFIRRQIPVKIAVTQDRPPYCSLVNGAYEGIFIELMHSIERNSGMHFEYIGARDYSDALDMLDEGKVDAVYAAAKSIYFANPSKYALTKAYFETSLSVVSSFAEKDMPRENLRLFVPPEFRFTKPISFELSGNAPLLTNSVKECLDKVRKDPESAALVTNLDIEFYTKSYKYRNLFTIPLSYAETVHMLVRRDKAYPLCPILDMAIARIRPAEKDAVTIAYLRKDISSFVVFLSAHMTAVIVTGMIAVLLIVSLIFMSVIQHLRRKKNAEIMRIVDIANRDSMTGLFNRATFVKMVEGCLEHRNSHQEKTGDLTAFVMLDVDSFKKINDTYGHSAGDMVLICLAGVLRSYFRRGDIPARFGGDEFAVFMPRIADKSALTVRMQGLIQEINRAFSVNRFHGRQIHATCSIGIAVTSDTVNTFTSLYNTADAALYKVKKDGKNSFCIAD